MSLHHFVEIFYLAQQSLHTVCTIQYLKLEGCELPHRRHFRTGYGIFSFTEHWVTFHWITMKICRILYTNTWRTGICNLVGVCIHYSPNYERNLSIFHGYVLGREGVQLEMFKGLHRYFGLFPNIKTTSIQRFEIIVTLTLSRKFLQPPFFNLAVLRNEKYYVWNTPTFVRIVFYCEMRTLVTFLLGM